MERNCTTKLFVASTKIFVGHHNYFKSARLAADGYSCHLEAARLTLALKTGSASCRRPAFLPAGREPALSLPKGISSANTTGPAQTEPVIAIATRAVRATNKDGNHLAEKLSGCRFGGPFQSDRIRFCCPLKMWRGTDQLERCRTRFRVSRVPAAPPNRLHKAPRPESRPRPALAACALTMVSFAIDLRRSTPCSAMTPSQSRPVPY
jgi:hypothetical protein